MRNPRRLIIAVLSASGMLLPGWAQAAGDAASGLTLAQTWCTSCHIVAPGGTGRDNAPSFMAIAAKPNLSEPALRAWLSDPHPPMPNLNLSRQQIDDVVAYLASLKPR